jgi:hypothetical protein
MNGSLPPHVTALDLALDQAIELAVAPLARCSQAPVRALAGVDDDIELPQIDSDPGTDESLTMAAPLYLAAHLEAAGLVVGAETVASLVAAGGFGSGLDEPAVRGAVTFWRERRSRLQAMERETILTRIFGTVPGLAAETGLPPDNEVELAMINLADALSQASSGRWATTSTGPVCATGRAAGQLLISRTERVPTLVAADLVAVVKRSVSLLRQPTVLRALGARTLWGGLEQILHRYRGEERPVGLHVGIGRDGVVLLSWLSDSWPQLGIGHCQSAQIQKPELQMAAVSWLRTALSLYEAPAPAAHDRMNHTAAPTLVG